MANFCTQCGKAAKPAAKFCDGCGAHLVLHDNQIETPPRSGGSFQAKRDRVLGQQSSTNKPKLVVSGLIGVGLILGLLAMFNSLPSHINPVIDQLPVVTESVSYPASSTNMTLAEIKIENGVIILPLEEVKEKKFVAFNYPSPNGVRPLLAYITGEGKIITAVSMCEPCNSKSFHIRSDELICNSCGTTWELNNLAGLSGACQAYPPDPLPNVVSGNEIRISEMAVKSWVPRM